MRDVLGTTKNNPHVGLLDHLTAFAGGDLEVQDWQVPNGWAPHGLSIASMRPTEHLPFWTLATAGCWQAAKSCHWRSEFVLAAFDERDEHVELLKMAAFFQFNPQFSIEPGKVLDIGRPWVVGSECTHLLASLPYPFGGYFEWPDVDPCTRFIWLLPITTGEAAIAQNEGVENLERLFDAARISFADPQRASVVA